MWNDWLADTKMKLSLEVAKPNMSHYICVDPAADDFDLGNGDFTIDCHIVGPLSYAVTMHFDCPTRTVSEHVAVCPKCGHETVLSNEEYYREYFCFHPENFESVLLSDSRSLEDLITVDRVKCVILEVLTTEFK